MTLQRENAMREESDKAETEKENKKDKARKTVKTLVKQMEEQQL